MFKNLIFQLFKTKGLAKTVNLFRPGKVLNPHMIFSQSFFPIMWVMVHVLRVDLLEWKVRAT